MPTSSPGVRIDPAAIRAALLAVALAGVVVLVAGAPVAWLLLAICAICVVLVIGSALRDGRLLDPLAIIYAFAGVYFVLRPFQLFTSHLDLASFRPPSPDPLKAALRLDGGELARFVTLKLHGPLQPALTHAIGACALFLVCVIAGYQLRAGASLGRRFERLGPETDGINARLVVIVCLLAGLVAQAAIVAKTGGVSEAFNSSLKQSALKAGFALYVMAGFSAAGVLVWAGWLRPTTRLAWAGFLLAVAEQGLFFALIGSRTRALVVVLALGILAHHLWRPIRVRSLVAAVLVAVILSGAILGVRNATYTKHFPSTLTEAPKYILDPRGLLNNSTQFDQLFVATSTIGHSLPYKGGGWAVSAVRSYLPSFIDHNKPEAGDIQFRKSVWGNELGAGRPISMIGDLLYDFGWAGIGIGAALLGIFIRGLGGLTAGRGRGRGRGYRVALYALAAVVLYELVYTTYSVGLNFALTIGVPFVIAVYGGVLLKRVSGGERPRLRNKVAAGS